jgi:hypothetical protein
MITAFGAAAVGVMFLSYWLEPRSRWFVAIFALASACASAYAWLIESYPFFVVEGLWAAVAFRRFLLRHRVESGLGEREEAHAL